jgi:pimeloyl-ACP methyl ester carboxylesterase
VRVPWRLGVLETWVLEADAADPDEGGGGGPSGRGPAALRREAGVVLLLHGWRGRRQWMLDRARMLLRAGYAVVIPDLPAHGASTGDGVTFGKNEGEAIDALLDYTFARFPDRPIGAIGVSLGGASLLMARRDVPLRAVVIESVYTSLRDAVAQRMRRFLGPAGPPLTPLLHASVGLLRGLSPGDVRPVDRIASLRTPLLCVHGAEDRSTPIDQGRALYGAAPGPKEYWAVPGADHVDLCDAAPAEYERRILDFLARHMSQ